MANFNLGLADKTDPSYMKDAKDVNLINTTDFKGAEGRQLAGDRLKAAESLFKNTIDSATETIKETAYSEIQQGVDLARNAQGVDLATSSAEATDAQTSGTADGTSPLSGNKPPNANEIENQFKRFQVARDQGKLSDTNYYGQLESLVRSVKSRYPGFERDIDQMIHRTTGITPANALREAIQQDMAASAAASNKESTKNETFVNNNLKWLSEQNLQDYRDGKLPFSGIQEIVRRNESYEANINRTKAELSRDSELKKVSDEKIVGGARSVAATVQSHLSDQFLSLADKAQKQIDTGTYDPKVFLAAMPSFRLQATSALQAQLNDKAFIGMPKEERAAIEKQFNDTLDNYEKAFTNPETGLLNFYKNQASARVDAATSQLLDRSPISNQVAAAQKLYPGLLPSLLSQGEGAAITEDIKQGVFNKQVPGSTGYGPTANQNNLPEGTKQELTNAKINAVVPDGVTPQQQLDSIGNFPQGRSSGTTNSYINNWQSILTNPKLPPEALKTAAEKMFNKNNLNFILDNFKNDGSQANAYQKLTSPAVTAQMEKLKGTPVWDNYTFWAKNNFANVYKDQVQALNKIADYPYIDLTFDKSTGRFGVKPSAEGIRMANAKGISLGGAVMDKIERLMGDRLSSKIEALNKSIDTIRPVLQGDNYDAANEIRSLTMHFGEHSDQKTNGIWNSMLKAIGQTEAKNPEDIEFGGTHPNFTQASGGKGSSGGKLSTETDITEQLKASFSNGESGNDYNRLVDTPTHPKRTNLTDMTIGEVLDFQKGMLRAGNPSSAAGKYQIVSTTLKSLVREGVVKMGDKYDENTQERLADALLERRGFNDFMAGKLPAKKFLKNLGNEWEIIKKSPAYAHKVLAALENDK